MSVVSKREETGTTLQSFQSASERARKRLAIFAWIVLAYNIPVILWGAYVRVSFSGDGCDARWPFCNGQLIPQKMAVPTVIEYTHRMMTGLDSLAVIAMCIWAFAVFPSRHSVRRYSILSVIFLLMEALLGAGLVLFRYVERDQSAGRAMYLSAHLTNTLLLLAALTVTAWAAYRNVASIYIARLSREMRVALAATIIVSVTGAVAALGDTLFPAASLAAGLRQDFSSTASMLLRLRMVHPLVAVCGAFYLIWVAARLSRRDPGTDIGSAAGKVIAITVFQLAVGVINIGLRAPVWMQLFHLLVADCVWIALVVMALETVRTVQYD
jgi:heme a synthase